MWQKCLLRWHKTVKKYKDHRVELGKATFSSRIFHFSDSYFRDRNIDFVTIQYFLCFYPSFCSQTPILLTVNEKCILGGFFSQYPVISCKSFLSLLSPPASHKTYSLFVFKAVVLKSSWRIVIFQGSYWKYTPEVWGSGMRFVNMYFLQSLQVSLMCLVFSCTAYQILWPCSNTPLVTCSSTAFHTFNQVKFPGFGLLPKVDSESLKCLILSKAKQISNIIHNIPEQTPHQKSFVQWTCRDTPCFSQGFP